MAEHMMIHGSPSMGILRQKDNSFAEEHLTHGGHDLGYMRYKNQRHEPVSAKYKHHSSIGAGAIPRSKQHQHPGFQRRVIIAEPQSSQNQSPENIIARALGGRDLFEDNRPAYVKRSMVELMIHLMFLFAAVFVAYRSRSDDGYYLNRVFKSLFVHKVPTERAGFKSSFKNMVTVDDYYNFALMTVAKQLVGSYAAGENWILGSPRFRQEMVADLEKNLFYNNSWKYFSAATLNESPYRGWLAAYQGGGFNVTVSKSGSTANILNALRDRHWIDRYTGAVFFSFVTYNANVNLFCIATMVAEFSPTTMVMTTADFVIVRHHADATVVFVFEIIIYGFVLFLFLQAVVTMATLGGRYWERGWNYIDAVTVIAGVCLLAFQLADKSAVRNKLTRDAIANAEADPFGHHINFREVMSFRIAWDVTLAILVLFAWIRLFKYTDISQTTYILSKTLRNCVKDIFAAMIVFMVVFIGFVQFAYILFGYHVKDFSTFRHSMFSLMSVMLGSYDTSLILEESNPVTVIVFFYIYTYVMVFVLVGTFIAVLIQSNHATRLAYLKTGSQMQLTDFIMELTTGTSDFMAWQNKMLSKGYLLGDISSIVKKHTGQPYSDLLGKQMTVELNSLSKSDRSVSAHHHISRLHRLQKTIAQLQANLLDLDVNLNRTLKHFTASKISNLRRHAVLQKLLEALIHAESQTESGKRNLITATVRDELVRLLNEHV